MQLKDVLQKTTQFFRDKGFSSPRLDTELLMARALQWDRMKLYMNYEYALTEPELTACRELVKRRASGEPVAYILGARDFYNHSFVVSSGVLIPRPETETIVQSVLDWWRSFEDETVALDIVDLGCGSGCIGLSIAAEVPTAKLVSVDIAETPVRTTRLNAERLAVANRSQVLQKDVSELELQDFEPAFKGLASVIVANPPYIAEDDEQVEANVRKFEPKEALFSPDGGLFHIRNWATKAADLIVVSGLVIFEIGYEQGQQVKKVFEETGAFEDVTILKDLAGMDRFVRAIRRGDN